MPRPLPRELMEQILGDECLRNSDFARYCRLSKDWLNFFRERLYSRIDVDLCEADFVEEDEEDTQLVKYQHSVRNLDLLSRLSTFPAVAGHVKAVRFERTYAEGCGVYTTPLTLFASIVYLCPSIDAVNFPAWVQGECIPYLTKLCAETGRRFIIIDMGAPLDTMWPLLEGVQDKLQHLRFGHLAGNLPQGNWCISDPPPVSLPALHLRSLSLPWWQDRFTTAYRQVTFDALVQHSHSSLQSIEVAFSPHVTLDFSPFAHLRALSLRACSSDHIQAVYNVIRSATCLTSLILYGGFNSSETERLIGASATSGLAAHLSPSLIRLELPHATALPPSVLLLLEHLPVNHPLRLLHFRKPPIKRENKIRLHQGFPPRQKEDYTAVEEACRERGIELQLT
ncbi:hypothetical protein JCM6882_008260 [Rhodosporidiobolus microsporus]